MLGLYLLGLLLLLLLRDGDRVVLIDCGMDDPEPLNGFIRSAIGEHACINHVATGGLVSELLAGHGLTPADVDVVALTHLHADHAGNVAMFPHARIAIGRRGWERHLARRQSHPALVGAPAFPSGCLSALDVAAADGRLLLADDDESVVDGMTARTIGGHTDDSTAYVVDSTAGHLVVPGDTIWTWENLNRDSAVGSNIDLPACFDAMAWARGAGDGLLPSHDSELMERYPDGRVTKAFL